MLAAWGSTFNTISGRTLAEKYLKAVAKGQIVLSQNSEHNWKLYVDRYCNLCQITGYRLPLFRPWDFSNEEYGKMAQAVVEHSLIPSFPRKEFECAMALYSTIDEGALKEALNQREIDIICVNVLVRGTRLSESLSKFLFSNSEIFKCVDEKNLYPLTVERLLEEPKLIEHILSHVEGEEEVAMAIRLTINLLHFCHEDETRLIKIKNQPRGTYEWENIKRKDIVSHGEKLESLHSYRVPNDVRFSHGRRVLLTIEWFEEALLDTLGRAIQGHITQHQTIVR